MSNFKDYLSQDIDNLFFNINEFVEMHEIDKQDLPIIVDNDRLMHRSKKEFDGISVGEILYYAKVSDFSKPLEQGQTQIFDGRPMAIFDVRKDNGIYEVILQQNRGR